MGENEGTGQTEAETVTQAAEYELRSFWCRRTQADLDLRAVE